MTLKEEAKEIVKNAREAYRRGEITAEQYQDATRIPLKDLYLTREAREERKMK